MSEAEKPKKIELNEIMLAMDVVDTLRHQQSLVDRELGTLEAGKLADITVIDRDIVNGASTDVLKMNIEMTIVDGSIVYQRPEQ